MTRERPILFSAPMVRAILDGSKTQTRRFVNPQPSKYLTGGGCCPYGVPGQKLWVRETWQALRVVNYPATYNGGAEQDVFEADIIPKERGDYCVAYAANDEEELHPEDRGFTWRPSIFMPRWASRITLEVTDVRVQRVQDISEEDARAEGCEAYGGICSSPMEAPEHDGRTVVEDFQDLWDSINGKKPGRSWDDNPWVWALSFRRVEP